MTDMIMYTTPTSAADPPATPAATSSAKIHQFRLPSYEVPSPHLERQTLSPNPLDRGKTSPWNLAKSISTELARATSEYSSDRPEPKYCLLLAIGRGRVLRISISDSISTRIPIYTWKLPLRDSLLHGTNNYGILSRWQSFQLCLLHLRDIFPYSSFRGSRRDPRTRPITPSIKRPLPRYAKRPRPGPLHLFVCAGRPLSIRGPIPRRPSNIDCWLLSQISTTIVWRRLWERQFSMHLRSRNLPRPSASSPPGNRSHPMANPAQAPDLEGLHREIHDMAEQMRIMNENNGRLMQLLAAANPPTSSCTTHAKHQAPPCVKRVPPNLVKLRPDREKGRSPRRGDHARARDKSTSQKIRDLDARLDAINTGTNAPVTVDALVRQTDPPFTKRVLGARISSKFKLPTQLGIYEGRTDPMDHLDSYKSLMSLQGCSDEVMCKAFSATLKGPARSWFRKLSSGTIDSFGELSRLFVANFMSCRNRQKNASHLFTVHQKETESLKDFVKRFNQAILEVEDPSDKSKADKYIAAEELAEAKRRRRKKDDHKRKEPDTRRNDYREETRYKRPDRDPKHSNNRRPRTPPRRPEFILPPLNAPVAQVLSEIKHEEFVKWPGKIKTDPQKRNRNKYCEFHRDHGHNTEDCFQLKEQIADLIKRGYLRKYITDRPPPNSPERRYGDNRPTTGNIQTIHGGFGSSGCSTSSRKRHARSAFRSVEEEVYNLSSPCVGDQPPITFSSDDLRGLHLPHDDALTTVWQDFIMVDCPSPYNAILGRPTLGGIKAITSTYHLKMKFPTLTGIGEVKGN
ncbi:hypothetical protein Acr_00g0005780 [Actinidia rufa]|uniref:Retrotransposon gag domain-containing protein n=1 Tax=Actinidia rufa TaxID=165716 RepID=A0A7J0D7V6_9ERIC|nr:hypothetical protein Acr_00g0005780 [Actinidia rufa]